MDTKRMLNGQLYNPFKTKNTWTQARIACKKFNESKFWEDENAFDELKTIFKKIGKNAILTAPFYCDHGSKISIGDYFYANTGLTILDENEVFIRDYVFIGPHVSIYTAMHPIDKDIRNMGLEYAFPVSIGNDVWICGNVVINPGVKIGNNVVIGSGSVVTKNIPDGVVAVGNPCKVIRKITIEDKEYWEKEYKKYQMEIHHN